MAKMCFVQLKWQALPILKAIIFLCTLMERSHQLKKEISGVSVCLLWAQGDLGLPKLFCV